MNATTTETKPRVPAPRVGRRPRILATFECSACSHTGIGRLYSLGLTCSGCGQVGTARELPHRV